MDHHTLAAEDLTLAYDEVEVVRGLSLAIPTNACGKSTLHRALTRLLKPKRGVVLAEAFVEQVFGLRCRVVVAAVAGTPHVLPIGRHHQHDDAVVGEA